MPIKPRYMQTTPAQRTVSLDASALSYLDKIAPDNISEALRYCVQFAMQHPEALFRATVQHTAAQCRKHQQRYPDNAAPRPTTYGGHVMKVIPAPAQVATPAPTQQTAVWTQPEPIQVAPQPMAPQVIHTSTPSAAALAAVAAIALTDEEIRALDPARGGQQPFVG